MGVHLKNNPSSLTTIVSESILQYLLMMVMALCILIPRLTEKPIVTGNTLVEFKQDASALDVEEVMQILADDTDIDQSSLVHITKSEAMDIMGAEVDAKMLDRISEKNPFRDVIRFSSTKSLVRSDITSAAVSGVYTSENAQALKSTFLGRLSLRASILLAILSCILYYIYFSSFSKLLFLENKSMIQSLKLYGSDNHFIKSLFNKSTGKTTMIAWILGILLFILTIYLILGILQLGFRDISIMRLVAIVIAPFVLTLVVKYFMINKAISISNN